ncbi:MAG TPA: Sec-independent protein translocase protein TatB [Hyphomicrobiaceae bacterium]|jgi:sec-independent protein translocase protein TatB
MFDITSSKLFLLAIVALLIIGPKDFPVLLRTIGKYMGIIRGHAREFRAQFDEAMRETELAQLKKDMENIAQETEASLNATGREVEQTLSDAGRTMEASLDNPVDNPVENPLAPAEVPPVPVPPEQAAEGVANLDGVPDAAAEPTPAPATAPVPAAQAAVALDESPAPATSGETATAPPAAPVSSPAPAQAAERTGA